MNETLTIHKQLTSTDIEETSLLNGNSETSGSEDRTLESYVREWRVASENEELFVSDTLFKLPKDIANDGAKHEAIIKTALIAALEHANSNLSLEIDTNTLTNAIEIIYKGLAQGGFVHWGQNYLKTRIPVYYRPVSDKKRFNIALSNDLQDIQVTFNYHTDLQPIDQKDIEFRRQLMILKEHIEKNTPFSLTVFARRLLDAKHAQKLDSLLKKVKSNKSEAIKEIELLLALPKFSSNVVYRINFNSSPQPKTISCSYDMSDIPNNNIIDLLIAQKEYISDKFPDRIFQQNLFNENLFTILENSNYQSSLTILKELLRQKVVTLDEVAFCFQKNISLKQTIEKALSDPIQEGAFSIRIPNPDLNLLLGCLKSLSDDSSEYYNIIVSYNKARNFQPDISVLRKLHEIGVFLINRLSEDNPLKNTIVEKTQSWEKKLIRASAQELRRIAAPTINTSQSYTVITASAESGTNTLSSTNITASISQINTPSNTPPSSTTVTPPASPRRSSTKPLQSKTVLSIKIPIDGKDSDITKKLDQLDAKPLAEYVRNDKSGHRLFLLIEKTQKPVKLNFFQRWFRRFFKSKAVLVLEKQHKALAQLSLEDYISLTQSADIETKSRILSAPDFKNKRQSLEKSYHELERNLANRQTQEYIFEPNFSNFLNLAIVDPSPFNKERALKLIENLYFKNFDDANSFAKLALLKKVLSHTPFFDLIKAKCSQIFSEKSFLLGWIKQCQDSELIALTFKHQELVALLSDDDLSKIRKIASKIHAPTYRIDDELEKRTLTTTLVQTITPTENLSPNAQETLDNLEKADKHAMKLLEEYANQTNLKIQNSESDNILSNNKLMGGIIIH